MPNQANIERFNGFARLYDEARPAPPILMLKTILSYAAGKPGLVADVGSGTGLSTFPWTRYAAKVIGIEPNGDFLEYARRRARGKKNIEFREGTSDRTGLPEASVDIITCSQSFHWMEPRPTLAEFGRLLAPGGVLAVYDYQWPLSVGKKLEVLHRDLIERADEIYTAHNTGEAVVKHDKGGHLRALSESGLFDYTRDVLLHMKKALTAEEFIAGTLSQGALQTVRRRWPTLIAAEVAEFEQHVRALVRGRIHALFSYVLVIGIKA
jgi:ubiquinone/menaquinone biosynthesis C-methylase UbiE